VSRGRAFWGAGSVVISLYALTPVLWMVSLSFKTPDSVTDKRFLPSEWTWDNYRAIFRTDLFTRALLNSVVVALASTVLTVLLATLVAYAIARLDFPGKRVVLSLALAVAVFPSASLVGPLFLMERSLGIYDTWAGLVLPYMSFTLPLAIWTLSALFREVPWEMEEAALVDGATPMQAWRRVVVPLTLPGVLTGAILVFLVAWNDFLFALSLTASGRARTVPAALAYFPGATEFQQPVGNIAAAAVVVTLPVVLVVLVFQRRIVAGLTVAAVRD
jgi:multiple sugar transport system permease protein